MKKTIIYTIIILSITILILLIKYTDTQKNNLKNTYDECIANKIDSLNNAELQEYHNNSDICFRDTAKDIVSLPNFLLNSIAKSTGASVVKVPPESCSQILNYTNESIKQDYYEIGTSCYMKVYGEEEYNKMKGLAEEIKKDISNTSVPKTNIYKNY
ncbi:MAG: hypothetical protein N4A31_03660 [Rickettsiales bacterium]|jgi:hypothetical protein|nr:hypothetical protein [Rickettsiales bacterium]